MEGRRHRSAVLAIAVVIACTAQPAAAEYGRDVRSETNGQGVEIVFERRGDGSVSGRAAAAGGNGCHYTAELYWDSVYGPPDLYGAQPSPEHRLYTVYCNDQILGVRWLGPAEFVDGIARGIAERVVREIPIGEISIGLRPESRGVTGIPSLFWVEGYDGHPINHSVTELGITVDVAVTLDDVIWRFGDGTAPLHAGLGEAWPQESSVRHTYEHVHPGYPVTATMTLAVRWRFNGGGWEALAPITRTSTVPYTVTEIQAIRDR